MPFFFLLLFFFFVVSSGTIQITKGEKSSPRRGRPKLRENEACGCEIGVEEYDAHAETDWWDTRKKLPFSSAKDALEKMSFNNSVLVMMTNAGEVDLLDNYLCSLRLVGLNKYIVFATDERAMKHLEYRGYNAVDGTNIINDNAKKKEGGEGAEEEEKKKKTENKLSSKDAEPTKAEALTQAKPVIVEFVLKRVRHVPYRR